MFDEISLMQQWNRKKKNKFGEKEIGIAIVEQIPRRYN